LVVDRRGRRHCVARSTAVPAGRADDDGNDPGNDDDSTSDDDSASYNDNSASDNDSIRDSAAGYDCATCYDPSGAAAVAYARNGGPDLTSREPLRLAAR